QQEQARPGLGMAVLPCYMAAADPQLGPRLPSKRIQGAYWISTRRELHKSVRLRVVWDYLMALCAAQQGVLLGPDP
ncbi:LysR family transcriptional regulator, partial [Pseudomonas sp. MWU12-2534b]